MYILYVSYYIIGMCSYVYIILLAQHYMVFNIRILKMHVHMQKNHIPGYVAI